MFCYCVYGLGLEINVALPALADLPKPEKIEVRMILGELPRQTRQIDPQNWQTYYTSPYFDTSGRALVTVCRCASEGLFVISYHDGTVIAVNTAGTRVWAAWPDSATVEDTATYLLGPTLGFVLRLRGITCLHASGVVIDNRVVAFAGASGAGKSSIAAAFAKSGFPVISDDVLALVEGPSGFDVQPAYPRVRLWGEAAQGLFGAEDALPLITPNWNKRFLDLTAPGYTFQRKPLPLSAIYLLSGYHIEAATAQISACSPREALIALVSHTYTSYLADERMRSIELAWASRVVSAAKVRAAALPSLDSPELCAAIVRDYRANASQHCRLEERAA